jgi:uncharacterized NAD-dependent epimerase/dehydratase family protein
VVAVIDPEHASCHVGELFPWVRHNAPVVATLAEARALGADVLVLGIAPLGGRIPAAWLPELATAVELGMSIVNGLHDHLRPHFPNLPPGQWIWDIREEPRGLASATGSAGSLRNRRVLMIGIDMSVGKMTAGLELHHEALRRGLRSAFIATGQIGMTIMGSGIPLDAIRVDYAAGAVEREVLAARDAELVIVEGQGSLLHPSSSATLPLIRGACPTHFIMCTRAGQTALKDFPAVTVPDLREFARLYEDVAAVCGRFPRPRTAGIAVNSGGLEEAAALAAIRAIQAATGLPTADLVREANAGKLLDALWRD